LVSHFILAISEVRDFKVLAFSSNFRLDSARLEEEGNSSLYFFSSLSNFFFDFFDASILESTSIATSYMENKVLDLLSQNRRENFASKEFANLILAKDLVGLISSGILLYIFSNLFVKYDTDSPLFLLKDPNSVM
jgi:hypothetical protein